MTQLNAFRCPAWVVLFALALFSGCSGSGDGEPADEGQNTAVASPLEEVPTPEPDMSEGQPAPAPTSPPENESEPTDPSEEPSSEDLTADLDDFFGTPHSSSGSLAAEESSASESPRPDSVDSAFGNHIASVEPPDAEIEPPVVEAEETPLPSEPALPVMPGLPLAEPPPIATTDKPDQEPEPSFADLFPPLEQPDPSPGPMPEPEPGSSEPPPVAADDLPVPVIPEWSPERPPEEPTEEPTIDVEPELPEEQLVGPESTASGELPFAAQPAMPEAAPAEEEDELPPPPVTAPRVNPGPDFALSEESPPARAVSPMPRQPKRPTLDVNNTRHLAWMLGAKLSLMATPEAGAKEWEIDALAEMLGIRPPDMELGDDNAKNVSRLLKAAATTGDQVAKKLGPEHAALLEIAVKSNSLAALYEQYPKLGPPVAAAIEKASDRAGIDAELCRPLLQTLRREPTAEQVREAVFALHTAMERSLRQP